MDSASSSSPLTSVPTSPASTLTELSRSPSPVPDDASIIRLRQNLTPPSSQGSSPGPDSIMEGAADRDADAPPAKRRKLSPKPRTTEHLDLRPEVSIEGQEPQLAKLLKVIHKRRKIVVIAGAGISVSAGVPDFRSSTGLFKSLKSEHNLKTSGKQLFDMSVYKDAGSTSSFHEMVRTMSQSTKAASPTPFHHLLATLAQEGRLLRLYSQNVDGIDTSMPPLATQVPLRKEDGAWPKTIQVHGSLHKMVCIKCHFVSDLDPELFDGPMVPSCPKCEQQDAVRTEHAGKRSHGVGKLRPRMVMYNEQGAAFDDEAIGDVMKADLRTRPDALIVVGTSFKIPGTRRIAYEMSQTVRDRKDGLTVWINLDPAPADKKLEWDVVVKGSCDEVARHAALRKWDEDPVEFVTEERASSISKDDTVEVVVGSPAKARVVQQMPTPASSPNLAASKVKSFPLLKLNVGPTTKKAKLPTKKAATKPIATAQTKPGAKRKYVKKADAKANNTKVTEAFKVSKTSTTKAKSISKSTDSSKENKPPQLARNKLDPMTDLERRQQQHQDTATEDTSKSVIPPSTPRRELSTVSPFDARQNANVSSSGGSSDTIKDLVFRELNQMAPLPSPLTGHRSRSLEAMRVPSSPTEAVHRKRVSLSERRRSETISPPGAPRDMRMLLD